MARPDRNRLEKGQQPGPRMGSNSVSGAYPTRAGGQKGGNLGVCPSRAVPIEVCGLSENDSRLRMSPGVLHRYSVYGITLASELRHSLPDGPREATDGVIVELRVAQPHTFRSLADKLPRNPNDWFQQGILEDGSLYLRWEDWLELLVSPDGKSV